MTPESARPWWLTQAGERRTYLHQIGADGPADRAMPTFVVRGPSDGPTFLALAGLHGDEYEGMAAVQREAARAFGLPLVWGTAPNEGRSLSAALELGVPAIYCETTGAGGCRLEDVSAYVKASGGS